MILSKVYRLNRFRNWEVISLRKWSSIVASTLVLGLLLTGCGTANQPSNPSPTGGTNSTSAQSIKLGADVTFPPFEQMQNGKVTGFDIDIITAIAKEANLKIDGDIKTMDFQGLIPAIQTGTIDVAVAGITIKPERAQQVNFSKPYYKSGLSILVKKDSTITGVPDLKGKTVAVKLGTTGDLMMSKEEGVTVKRFNNIDEAYRELQNSGADAVIFDNPVHQNYINTGHDNVKVVGGLLTGEDYGIAVTKKDAQLVNKINDGLDKIIKSGEYEKIYKQYFKDDYGLVNKK